MRLIKHTTIFLFWLFGSVSHAYEPVTPSVEEALKKGEVAFIGRALSINEISYSRGVPKVETHFLVIVPLYGPGVAKGKIIKIRHFSRGFIGYPKPAFGIQFLVSEEYLVVLNSKHRIKGGSYLFDSTTNKNADIAYSVDDTRQSPFYTKNRKEHYYSTMYSLGFKGNISFHQLIKWANQRRSQLN
jgi:hypothetical protein